MNMFIHPSLQIIGYTGIENGMCGVGENVNKVIFTHSNFLFRHSERPAKNPDASPEADSA